MSCPPGAGFQTFMGSRYIDASGDGRVEVAVGDVDTAIAAGWALLEDQFERVGDNLWHDTTLPYVESVDESAAQTRLSESTEETSQAWLGEPRESLSEAGTAEAAQSPTPTSSPSPQEPWRTRETVLNISRFANPADDLPALRMRKSR